MNQLNLYAITGSVLGYDNRTSCGCGQTYNGYDTTTTRMRKWGTRQTFEHYVTRGFPPLCHNKCNNMYSGNGNNQPLDKSSYRKSGNTMLVLYLLAPQTEL